MIPVPQLDNESFDEINENAVNMISGLCPQWTDYNKHDPGITFIELFSWLKEMQQYYLDNINDGMKEKYLMMLGMKKAAEKCAVIIAEGRNSSDRNILIPAKSGVFADNICFETIKPEIIQNNQIENIILSDGEIKKFSSETNRLMYILPFGRDYKTGNSFEITFKNPLPCGHDFGIYFSVFNDYPVKRNPVYDRESFIPLADMDISILTTDGWKKADITDDETYCFIQSGMMTIKIPENTPDGGYRMRFTLKKCDYETAPAVTGIKMNAVRLYQKKTLAEYYDNTLDIPFTENSLYGKADVYLKSGDGFVKTDDFTVENNRIILMDKKAQDIRIVLYDNDFYEKKCPAVTTGFPYQEIQAAPNASFKIMIYDRYDNMFYEWEQKDNFDNSDPESRHFVYDSKSGIIRFGNGERGLSPDGEIIITAYSETLAENGNIRSSELKSRKYDFLSFGTAEISENGRSAESYEECMQRFSESMKISEKNVTYEDFERCVRSTQGLMIRQCKAVTAQPFERTNGIILIVQPYSDREKPKLSRSYTENILKNTGKGRLVGTKINVVSCQYTGIDIYAEICVKSHYSNTYDIIKNAVADMFENNRFSLGGTVSYSSIYHMIDALECVNYVKLLNMTADGSGYTISDSGDIILPQNGIAYLANASYTISETRQE